MCIFFKKRDDNNDRKQLFCCINNSQRCICFLFFQQNMRMNNVWTYVYIIFMWPINLHTTRDVKRTPRHIAPRLPKMAGHVRGQIPFGRHPSQNCQLRHTSCAVIHMSRSSALKLKREQIRGHMPFGWQSSQNHEDGGGENPSQSQPSS